MKFYDSTVHVSCFLDDMISAGLPALHMYSVFTECVSEVRNDRKREECTISDVIGGFP